MTPTERHTKALATLRVERDRLHHVYLPPQAARLRRLYDHAIRTLERHHPNEYCPVHGTRPVWPCPDAQSALDAITEAGS